MSNTVYLEDVCEILDNQRVPITAKDRTKGVYPYYGANGIQDYVDDYIFDDELVLLAEDGGNFGSTEKTIAYRVSGKCWVNNHAHVLKAKECIDVDYLCYSLMFYDVSSLVNGATRQKLNQAVMRKMKIVLPELDIQRDIVSKLDKVTHTIDLCNAILEKLDLLVKSRFVEMFGDTQKNDRNWLECPLGKICEKIVRYPTFYGMDYIDSGTRVIRIGNILNDGHMDTDDDNYVFVYDGVNDDFPETVIEENDIVMAVRGDGSAAKRIGFITEKCLIGANISPNLIRIKANQNFVIPIFLFYYLTSEIGQKRLDAYVNKTAKKNIAAKDIVKVISPVPPIALQEQFAAFVEQTDKSKFVVKQVMERLKPLKKALMQKYFG